MVTTFQYVEGGRDREAKENLTGESKIPVRILKNPYIWMLVTFRYRIYIYIVLIFNYYQLFHQHFLDTFMIALLSRASKPSRVFQHFSLDFPQKPILDGFGCPSLSILSLSSKIFAQERCSNRWNVLAVSSRSHFSPPRRLRERRAMGPWSWTFMDHGGRGSKHVSGWIF